LPEYDDSRYFSPDFAVDWIAAEEIGAATPAGYSWIPASSVYLTWPAIFPFSSNGLASGNHLTEATLHALYEVIERDAIASLSVGGRIRIHENCRVVALEMVEDPVVRSLDQHLKKAGIKLVLLAVGGPLPIATFVAVILDPDPFGKASMVNLGYGTHLSPSVAASRAITEAVQARLTLIHGSREDVDEDAYGGGRAVHEKIYKFFDRLSPSGQASDFTERSSNSLEDDYRTVTAALKDAGYDRILRVDLTREPFGIPVVKVIVPGMRLNRHLV
jgi:ribosomal protein S12 methylthiotransferase accessory factor